MSYTPFQFRFNRLKKKTCGAKRFYLHSNSFTIRLCTSDTLHTFNMYLYFFAFFSGFVGCFIRCCCSCCSYVYTVVLCMSVCLCVDAVNIIRQFVMPRSYWRPAVKPARDAVESLLVMMMMTTVMACVFDTAM